MVILVWGKYRKTMRFVLLLFMVFSFRLNAILCFGLMRDTSFLSTLPIGKYRLIFKTIINCNPTSNNKINLNYYIHRKEDNLTEIRGNITNKIPLDDTLTFELKISMKDPNYGWRENVFTHKFPKACSSFKAVMASAWIPYTKGLGYPNSNCPLPAGFYKIPGLDTSVLMATNFPKTFFYGLYKCRQFYSRDNEIFGCNDFIVEVKRP